MNDFLREFVRKNLLVENKIFTINSEVNFWSRQMSEHALFLSLGMTDQKLKRDGDKLHKEWEKLRSSENIKDQEKVLKMLDPLEDYKKEVLSSLESGKWLGWIFPLFVDHVIRELNYFRDKIQEKEMSTQDEMDTWTQLMGEHAAFSSHLLDPSEGVLIESANKLHKKFDKMKPSVTLVVAEAAGSELDSFVKAAEKGVKGNKIKSIIHPVLISHVVREGNRFLTTIDKLKK